MHIAYSPLFHWTSLIKHKFKVHRSNYLHFQDCKALNQITGSSELEALCECIGYICSCYYHYEISPYAQWVIGIFFFNHDKFVILI